MPWSPFIFLTVLCGAICGNRLTDNHRLLRPWTAAAPGHGHGLGLASALGDELQLQQATFRQRPTNDEEAPRRPARCRPVLGLEEQKFLSDFYGLKECPNEFLGALESAGRPDDEDEAPAPALAGKTPRDFLGVGSPEPTDGDEVLGDMMGLEAPPSLLSSSSSLSSPLSPSSLSPSWLSSSLTPAADPEPSGAFATRYLAGNVYRGERRTRVGGEREREDETELEAEKRAGAPAIGCDCKIKNDLLDLGQQHFPRYLLNAVCQGDSLNDYPQKCWHGSQCKPLEYKVKVLTFRNVLDHTQKDPLLAWLPDDLRQLWKFKTVTVAAGCFCSY